MTHPILELQAVDTAVDQLRYRRQHLPERDAWNAAVQAVTAWEREHGEVEARIDELTAAIERSETASHDIDVKRDRLRAQLRTVIAPREAEALQHEIATLEQHRGELDDAELAALEEQAAIDDRRAALDAGEPALRVAVADAAALVEAAEREIVAELARLTDRVDGLRDAVDATLLARYDSYRRHDSVAAAALIGTRCDGCHLDLSPAEVDEARAAAAAGGGITDCPQCARLLVI